MKALILAAGYAVRLYPLTKQFPKPLLKVKGKPIIDYIVSKVCRIEEVDEIIVVTNSRFFSVVKKWAAAKKINKPLSVIDDLTKTPETRLGAIGDINFAIDEKNISDDLLIIGGDNLFDAQLTGFISFVKTNNDHPAIGVFDIGDLTHADKYGIIKLDPKNRIVDFQEKPKKPQSSLVAMCLYYFPQSKLGLIKEYFKCRECSRDATGFYIDWLRQREQVMGFVFDGQWYDIGDHKFYGKAKESFKTTK